MTAAFLGTEGYEVLRSPGRLLIGGRGELNSKAPGMTSKQSQKSLTEVTT